MAISPCPAGGLPCKPLLHSINATRELMPVAVRSLMTPSCTLILAVAPLKIHAVFKIKINHFEKCLLHSDMYVDVAFAEGRLRWLLCLQAARS